MNMDNQQNKPQARAEKHQAADYYAAVSPGFLSNVIIMKIKSNAFNETC
jgi:hypothetical protein